MSGSDFDETDLRKAVDRYLENWGHKGTHAEGRGTPFGRALLALADAAARPNPSDSRPATARVDEALRFAEGMKFAAHTGADLEAADFWQHLADPISTIRSNNAPRLQRDGVEALVGEYLGLSYRSQHIDRLLVDMLIAQELLAYGGPVLNYPTLPGIESRYSVLKVRPAQRLAVGVVADLALALGAGALLVWLSSVGILPPGWLTPLLVLVVALAVLMTTWSLIRYPGYAKAIRERQSAITRPLRAMVDIYLSLESAGPLSAAYTLRKVEEAERSSGVGWPSSVYPLLNDILSRGDRF